MFSGNSLFGQKKDDKESSGLGLFGQASSTNQPQ